MMVAISFSAEERFMVFVGAASKQPTEEAEKTFEKKTGVKVDLVSAALGYVLSQMILTKKRTFIFSASSDYMELIWNRQRKKELSSLKQKDTCSISCLPLMFGREIPRI